MTDLEKQKKILDNLPEVCHSVQKLTGERIFIRKGERGYYALDWNTGSRRENLRKCRQKQNEEIKP